MLASLSAGVLGEDNMEEVLAADMSVGLMEMVVTRDRDTDVREHKLGVMSVGTQPAVITWSELRKATEEDKVLAKLIEEIQRGLPDSSHDMLKELREFHKYRHGLLVMDGVVTYKRRLVIPEALQSRVLETLHAAHQGVSSMVNRAEQSVFWPSITTDIARVRSVCRTCVRNAPSQPAGKPVAPPSPLYPFQMLVTDYCHMNGVNYLMIADRYSGWLSVLYVGRGEFDSDNLINVFRDYFLTFGVAAEISSDGASQYKSRKFERFLEQYGVRHRVSSSYFPHSNTRAELAVKTGKRILMDNMSPDGMVNNDSQVPSA